MIKRFFIIKKINESLCEKIYIFENKTELFKNLSDTNTTFGFSNSSYKTLLHAINTVGGEEPLFLYMYKWFFKSRKCMSFQVFL